MNKQQLANKIWESANQMRSKIEANEYKDYILGFIFYKYLSEQQHKFLVKEEFTKEDIEALSEEDEETVNHIKKNVGYFIAYDHMFNTWINKGKDFDVADVRDALSAFSRLISKKHQKLFKDIFDTLQTGLSKLGENAAKQTKAISDLLQLIKDIPMDGKQDYDVLGFVYEYLIGMFAQNAGKKAGEFYTPNEVSVLMSEIIAEHLKDQEEIKIYDSCSGSGSLLINIGNSVTKHLKSKDNIKYFAQELTKNTFNLTRMNLVMRGILPDNIEVRNGDTLEEDWPFFDENDKVSSYERLRLDAVVSNPPYSQKWSPDHKENDPRYNRFGLAPKTKADFAFLLHDLYHLKPNGIMNIVLPHGVLFRGGSEAQIRKELIEQNHIDAIIGLPAGIFFGTGIPTVIIVIKQKRQNTDTLIIDASKGFIKEGKNNKLRASDIKRITDAIRNRTESPKFSKRVSKDTIRKNDYNLNIPRYVDSSPEAESYDIYASMFGGIPKNELAQLNNYWQTFTGLKDTLVTQNTPENYAVKVNDIKETIENHQTVKNFVTKCNTAFNGFDTYLNQKLITNVMDVKVSAEKEEISQNIFERLNQIDLIDEYTAYQYFSDAWQEISNDIETIHLTGKEATTHVIPNMVTKKVKGKDAEVQQGWKGRILPFSLVQKELLADEVALLEDLHNKLIAIESSLTELDEKVATAKEAIENGAENDEELEVNIATYNKSIKSSKADRTKLNRELKKHTESLHLNTKNTIENLNEAQVNTLLNLKWVQPVVKSINSLPNNIITQLTQKVTALADKYATTYAQVAKDIQEAENNLVGMIDELEGSDFDMKGLHELQTLLTKSNH
ncbi:type I restriction-modification system subunit M [Tenacibaculum finnmarkense]|uniref:type I restriction-modification system subunit M n=1 Tax=Tenacibaculum finnmarkense TaxID=2781243 RepID=UPI001EFBE4D0|nr:type I restriction-modification system subunit M [Tenacibaculum finnmarkense]MCG8722632.1 type I restriction-modification system subunit M [Tenacibaculum finnmarkense]